MYVICITCLLLISHLTKMSELFHWKTQRVFGLAVAGKDLVDHVLAIGWILGENLHMGPVRKVPSQVILDVFVGRGPILSGLYEWIVYWSYILGISGWYPWLVYGRVFCLGCTSQQASRWRVMESEKFAWNIIGTSKDIPSGKLT